MKEKQKLTRESMDQELAFRNKQVAQLEDNLAAAGCVLDDDDLAALDAASALPSEYPGWMLEFQPAERRGLVE